MEEQLVKNNISDDVLSDFIVDRTLKIKGVNSFAKGLTANLTNSLLGKEFLHDNGVRISRKEDRIFVDINIIVNYGAKIPQLAWEIQKQVSKSAKERLNVTIEEINIHVQGVSLPGGDK